MKTVKMITGVLVLVLGLAGAGLAGQIQLLFPVPQDIPDCDTLGLSQVVSGVPASCGTDGVWYQITVDDRGNASNFWCNDYIIDIGLSSATPGSVNAWSRMGGTTDMGLDNDPEDDSDIDLDWATLDFDRQSPNGTWSIDVTDASVLGLGRVTFAQLWIYYSFLLDLKMSSPEDWSFSPPSVIPGQAFQVSCSVANVGISDTGPFTVRFYASPDSTIDPGDHLIGQTQMSGLDACQTHIPDCCCGTCNWSGSLPVDIPAGDYYVGCIIDVYNQVNEGDETNNTGCTGSPALTVLPMPQVPNVVGMTESAASSTLTSAGMTVGTKWYGESDTFAAGTVMGQDPAAGTPVPPGSAVELTISTGPSPSPQIAVPNVIGMTQAAAQSAITNAGLVVGTTTQASSGTVPAGCVISQDPAAETSVAKNSAVDLVLSTGPATGVDPNLLAWWKLDETSGDIVYDSAAENDGVAYGAPVWQPAGGKLIGAMKFDGVNDYVQLPIGSMIRSLTNSTFATWVNWTGARDWERIFDFGSGTNVYMYLTPRTDTGVMRFGITNAGNTAEDQVTAPQALATGWHHVAVTIDAAGKVDSLYLDAQLKATKTAARYTPSSLGTTTQNWLARCQWVGSVYLKGLLDDFRIYNRVLSAVEIGQLVQPTAGDTSLLAWWKLDEASGDIVYDSAAENDGVAYGTPVWQPAGGKLAGALKLDGANDYVQLPIGSMIRSLTNSTFVTWVNWTGTGGDWQRIFDFGSSTQVYMFLTPRNGNTGTLRFAITNTGSGGEDQATTSQVLPIGWHHVAVTIDAANRMDSLYVDGQLKAAKTAARYTPSSLGTTTQNWLGKSQWPDPYFSGSLDDFRIYNRVLSDANIAELAGITGPAEAGLVAHWKLDETSGTLAGDSAGDNDGTLSGGPLWLAGGGKVNGTLSFDGIDDYVNCGNAAALTIRDRLTLACWIKVASFTKEWATILAKGDSAYRLARSGTGNAMHFGITGTSAGFFDGVRTVADNQWHHVTAVYDGAQAAIYVDGVLDRAAPATGQINANSFPLNLGENAEMPGRYFKGLLDDVRIYNRAVSVQEIQQMMLGSAP